MSPLHHAPARPKNQHLQRIAIIGAGIAGLSCANQLAEAGHQVDVFDKSRGPSGRMSTRRGEDDAGPWQCDHGAQYFTAKAPAFQAQVRQWIAAGAAATWTARLSSHDGVAFAPLNGALERFVGVPRMTAPAAHMLRMLTERPNLATSVCCAHTIVALHRTDNGWRLETQEQGQLPDHYHAVLTAVPAPQAWTLLRPLSPAGATLAASARMRGCWAVMLRTASPLPLPWDGIFVNHGPLGWVARDSSKPGRFGPETWLLHATPVWSEAHIETHPDAVIQTLLHAFAAIGGPAPTGVRATAHRWRYADTAPALTTGCWWDKHQGLGLCGDWLNGGKVEGAWLSGCALAERILNEPTD